MVLTKAGSKSVALLKQKHRRESSSNQSQSDSPMPMSPVSPMSSPSNERKRAQPFVWIDNRTFHRYKRLQQQASDDMEEDSTDSDSSDTQPLSMKYASDIGQNGCATESELTDLSLLATQPEVLGPSEPLSTMDCGSSDSDQPMEESASEELPVSEESEETPAGQEPCTEDQVAAEPTKEPTDDHCMTAEDEVANSSDPKIGEDQLIDQICAQLPDPTTLCSSDFTFMRIPANVFEPSHVLVPPRDKHSMIQAKFEYTVNDFSTPEDPALWQRFQQKKYARWAKVHPMCLRATVRLIPQQTVCARTNLINQPQCRACIGRIAGKRCRFADIRYATKLTIELTDGTTATRYLICPVFRSQIDKAPEIRQSVTPIILPEDCVVDNDDSWVEFHVLCQTVSSIKSLLRRELAVVRDVQVSALRGMNSGAILFHSAESLPQAVQDETGNELHPLYGCAPSPCILRKVPFGAHQKCDICSAPIFSTYFSCCLCMQEICVECFSEWDDGCIVERCFSFEKGAKNQTDSKSGIAYCKRYTCTEDGKAITYSTQHKKRQFVRVSHFSDGELEMMLRKVNCIVQYCDLLDETQPAGYSSISLCANALQRGGQKTRVDYSWTSSTLDQIDRDTEVIASLGDADFGADPGLRQGPRDAYDGVDTPGAGPSHSQSHYLEAQWDAKLATQLLSSTRAQVPAWRTQPVYVSGDNLTLREFARLWEDGRVIVVTGLLSDEFVGEWTPQALREALGELPVHVAELNSWRPQAGEWTLRQFLQLFDEGIEAEADLQQKKLLAARLRANVSLSASLDDAADELHRAQVEAVRERARALLPFAQYTAAEGQLNLVNRLPAQYARPPDFGPELHCMYGTQGAGSVENLRCEVADVVSLLVYASSADHALPAVEGDARRRSRRTGSDDVCTDAEACVEWDIYGPGATDHVRSFVDEVASGNRDVMHGQVHISDEWQQELFELYGDDARACRVQQSVGDAVFVPAGSLYQRRTFRNTSHVQAKFLSPEHTATARRVSGEVTSSKAHVRRREALPVMDILWWTWMGSDAAQADEVISTARSSAAKKTPARQAPSRRTQSKQTPSKRTQSQQKPSGQTQSQQKPSGQTPSKRTQSQQNPSGPTPSKRGRGRGKKFLTGE